MKPGDLLTVVDRDGVDLWLMPWQNSKANSAGDMHLNDRIVGKVRRTDVALCIALVGDECMVMCGTTFGWTMLRAFET